MLRRLTVGCAAIAVVAAAGFFPAAATGSATAKTICVGLVVDPRAAGGSVSDACVNVAPGSTGLDVLGAGGHSVTFRKDGLLCAIDGLPTSGCDHVDNTHYWAYFHRAPDKTLWSYSNEGAATYEPANRSTDGWVYDDGSSLKPENIPAAQICAGLLKPTPAPTPSPKHTKVHPTPTVSIATSGPARPTKHHAHSPHVTPSATATAPISSIAPFTPTPAVSTTASSAPESSGHGSAVGAAIAAAVIAVLIASGVLTTRRRRSP